MSYSTSKSTFRLKDKIESNVKRLKCFKFFFSFFPAHFKYFGLNHFYKGTGMSCLREIGKNIEIGILVLKFSKWLQKNSGIQK